MTQKEKEGESENVIGRMLALRWEPTHVTKHSSKSIPLHWCKGTAWDHLDYMVGFT